MVDRARAAIAGRSGHSLPELVVALAFLGASLTAMASASVLASRWTGDAVGRQRVLVVAEAILDSLITLPEPPLDGSTALDLETIAWVVDSVGLSGARMVEVTALGAGHRQARVQLRGLWIPPLLDPLP
jgi:Tfp pilus assembly protein PilV